MAKKPRHFQRLYTLEELVRGIINYLKDATHTLKMGNVSTAEDMYNAAYSIMSIGDMTAMWTWVDHDWPTDMGPELIAMVKEVNKLYTELGDALREEETKGD